VYPRILCYAELMKLVARIVAKVGVLLTIAGLIGLAVGPSYDPPGPLPWSVHVLVAGVVLIAVTTLKRRPAKLP
jgi:hypothetical protein